MDRKECKGKQKMQKWKSDLRALRGKNFLFLFLAGVVNAVGVTLFIAPVELYDSGISGTSIFLSQITPPYFSLSLFLLLLNIPLFLFGMKKQGLTFTVYSVFTVTVYSLAAWLITDVLPINVSTASPLAESDLLLCALFGGIVSGVGSGLAIRHGGAMDGIEVLAVIFAKRLGLTIGSFMMLYNSLLYIVCGIYLSSWILPLYSIVTYMAGLKTVDFIVEGLDREKAATIVTTRPKEICERLSAAFECGITTYEARGFYSGEDKTVVLIVLNRFGIGKMKEIIRATDPRAYVSITEVADVMTAGREENTPHLDKPGTTQYNNEEEN